MIVVFKRHQKCNKRVVRDLKRVEQVSLLKLIQTIAQEHIIHYFDKYFNIINKKLTMKTRLPY
jgi:hypothetical protein